MKPHVCCLHISLVQPYNRLAEKYLLVPLRHVWSHFIGCEVKGHFLKLLLFICESMSSCQQRAESTKYVQRQ